ncbi:MAG: efflux RND transporter periplasmic adaptor subunit, partial [Gammaproteobacteria bacterium]
MPRTSFPTSLRRRPRLCLVPLRFLLVPLLCLATACERGKPSDAAAATPPPSAVTVAAALAREVVDSDEFPARLAAVEHVEVRARVAGYLDAIHFTPGSIVAAGDLLFTIDPRPFAARLAAARAERADTAADLELARSELARQQTMLADRATSVREADAARARVARLEAMLAAHDASIASAELDLAYTRVTAPIAGRVGKEEVTVGNLVRGDAPDSPVLTTLVSVDPVYVVFEADESAWLRYLAGERGADVTVEVALAGEDDFPHRARLAYVGNAVDPLTGTLRLRALLDNPDGRFLPGLAARVRLRAGSTARQAVVIADRAIGPDQSRRFVLVVDAENIARYREVVPGRLADGLRVIEQGLEPGEQIIVNGLQRVRAGSPVAPE